MAAHTVQLDEILTGNGEEEKLVQPSPVRV